MNIVRDILIKIKNTSSVSEKKRIISDNGDNLLFCETLVFLLSPDVVTGISRKKINKKVNPLVYTAEFVPDRFSWNNMKDYLDKHNTGTDKDIAAVQAFINNQPDDMREFYMALITKTLKIGCNVKLVNSALPGLINVWEIQQAYSLSDYTLKPDEWISLSQKLNGVHGSYFGGKMISRQGKVIKGLDHILSDVIRLKLTDYFIDGELIRKNTDNTPDEMNYRLTTGLINSDTDDKSEIEFVIYEVLTHNEFVYGCERTYKDRLGFLQLLENTMTTIGIKNIRVVDRYYSGTDHSEIAKWLAHTDAKGLEGCMLNRDTLYQKKRNNGILKVKSWKYCDLRVIGVAEGQGKYTGTLGKIIVDYKGNEVGISGMSDAERAEFWNNPDNIIGKIVTIKFKTESHDKNGVPSLNFASFIGVRSDKDEPSYE